MSVFYGVDVRSVEVVTPETTASRFKYTFLFYLRGDSLRVGSIVKPGGFGLPYDSIDVPLDEDSKIVLRGMHYTSAADLSDAEFDVGVEVCSLSSGGREHHTIGTVDFTTLTESNIDSGLKYVRINASYKLSDIITDFDTSDVAHMVFTLKKNVGNEVRGSVVLALLVDGP